MEPISVEISIEHGFLTFKWKGGRNTHHNIPIGEDPIAWAGKVLAVMRYTTDVPF